MIETKIVELLEHQPTSTRSRACAAVTCCARVFFPPFARAFMLRVSVRADALGAGGCWRTLRTVRGPLTVLGRSARSTAFWRCSAWLCSTSSARPRRTCAMRAWYRRGVRRPSSSATFDPTPSTASAASPRRVCACRRSVRRGDGRWRCLPRSLPRLLPARPAWDLGP